MYYFKLSILAPKPNSYHFYFKKLFFSPIWSFRQRFCLQKVVVFSCIFLSTFDPFIEFWNLKINYLWIEWFQSPEDLKRSWWNLIPIQQTVVNIWILAWTDNPRVLKWTKNITAVVTLKDVIKAIETAIILLILWT